MHVRGNQGAENKDAMSRKGIAFVKDRPTVILCTPVLLLGGTEMQMLTLVGALISAGYHVSVCCYYEHDEQIVRQFRKIGAKVTLLGLNRARDRYGYRDGVRLIKNLRRILKAERPQIVHIQYLAPGFLPVLAARLAGVKTIIATSHIAGSFAYGKKAIWILHIAARMCTIFLCVSAGTETFWFGDSHIFSSVSPIPRRKHFTVYNAVDTVYIDERTKSTDKDEGKRALGCDGKRVIGMVGRLAHQKGHSVLLTALKQIIAHVPEAILLVVGDGPEKEALHNMAESAGLANKIIWLGARSQNDVFSLYGLMDVFVMPSLYEGFGLTAAEAMAAGLPVVGTRIEGLSEVIEDGVTGYLVPPGDSDALAGQVIKLLEDEEKSRKMGERGKQRVRSHFSLMRFRETMINLYEYALSESDRRSATSVTLPRS